MLGNLGLAVLHIDTERTAHLGVALRVGKKQVAHDHVSGHLHETTSHKINELGILACGNGLDGSGILLRHLYEDALDVLILGTHFLFPA